MEIGKFDSDGQALKQRIVAHDKYSARDLNTWIFEHLVLNTGFTILELGCGIGKQTLPMAKITSPAGHIFAVDIASEGGNFNNFNAIKFACFFDFYNLKEIRLYDLFGQKFLKGN